MGRETLVDTRRQNAWRELIEKEAHTRLTWQEQFGSARNDDEASSSTTRKRPAERTTKTVRLPDLKELQDKSRSFRLRRANTFDSELLMLQSKGEGALSVEMKPAAPELKKSLFDGFTKEGKGRYQYLAGRRHEGPEDKFQYPLLSSWEYGWRLGEVVKEYKTPEHGRCRKIHDTFYRRNGVFYQ